MNVLEVPLGFSDFTDAQKRKVMETLDKNQTSRAELTARLEQLLAADCDVKRAVFMVSGTSALQLALEIRKQQAGWAEGSAVVVPATTFIASASSVLKAGLTPVLCDVCESDYNIDFRDAEKVASEYSAVAVMAVHLLGRACDMDEAIDLSDRIGIDLIEDCCEAFCVEHDGERVGSFGTVGAISTFASHHLSTGTGGAVITNSDWIADKAISLMQHGTDGRPYCFEQFGHSLRLTEMEAALGVAMLEDSREWESRQKARIMIGREISNALRPFRNRICEQEWPEGSVPMFYPIEVDSEEHRDGLMSFFDSCGIRVRPMLPLVTQPPIRQLLRSQGKSPQNFPNALDFTRRCFLIGCHPGMGAEHVMHIRNAAETYFSQRI